MTNTDTDNGGPARKTVFLETPSVPNYVRVTESGTSIDVAELSDAEIDELGAAWIAALKKKAKARGDRS